MGALGSSAVTYRGTFSRLACDCCDVQRDTNLIVYGVCWSTDPVTQALPSKQVPLMLQHVNSGDRERLGLGLEGLEIRSYSFSGLNVRTLL